ncbi:endothelial transcription factor GATA-2 isoform X1 [Lates japonicus]|uniref:Endothelial transcription factor GATA-2 isoform X1 n=1 Tax=Lates japonicus TaxID=270547 RepID=A0AAD3NIP2_LATJO|nr:endothelial transcription factor GATA-2 isoform X1 [Lates japonicus]
MLTADQPRWIPPRRAERDLFGLSTTGLSHGMGHGARLRHLRWWMFSLITWARREPVLPQLRQGQRCPQCKRTVSDHQPHLIHSPRFAWLEEWKAALSSSPPQRLGRESFSKLCTTGLRVPGPSPAVYPCSGNSNRSPASSLTPPTHSSPHLYTTAAEGRIAGRARVSLVLVRHQNGREGIYQIPNIVLEGTKVENQPAEQPSLHERSDPPPASQHRRIPPAPPAAHRYGSSLFHPGGSLLGASINFNPKNKGKTRHQ